MNVEARGTHRRAWQYLEAAPAPHSPPETIVTSQTTTDRCSKRPPRLTNQMSLDKPIRSALAHACGWKPRLILERRGTGERDEGKEPRAGPRLPSSAVPPTNHGSQGTNVILMTLDEFASDTTRFTGSE